jgi:hypothetical protein
MAGRPPRQEAVEPVLLRIPPALLQRVERCQRRMAVQEDATITRTEAFWRIIEAGCAALERQQSGQDTPVIYPIPEISASETPAPSTPAAQAPGTSDTPGATEEAVTEQKSTRKAPAAHGLPRETLEAIADERTRCEGLSYSEFAQRLHDRGIYSSRAKDGSLVPANRGNVKKWLDQAREAGLL